MNSLHGFKCLCGWNWEDIEEELDNGEPIMRPKLA